jgi:hypothetical protein
MKLESILQLLNASDDIARHPPEVEVSVEEAREIAKFCIGNYIGILQEIVKHEGLSEDCFGSDDYGKIIDAFRKTSDEYVGLLASKSKPELAENWEKIKEKLEDDKLAACEKMLGGGEFENIAISCLGKADSPTRFAGLTFIINDINLENHAASLAYAQRGILRQGKHARKYIQRLQRDEYASKDLIVALVLDPSSELAAKHFCSLQRILTPDERAQKDKSVKDLKPIATPEEYEDSRANFAWYALEVQSIKQTIDNYYSGPEPFDAKEAEAVRDLLKSSLNSMEDRLYLLSRCKKQDFNYGNFFKGIERIVKALKGENVSSNLRDLIGLDFFKNHNPSYRNSNLSKAYAWCGFDELRHERYDSAVKDFERALSHDKTNADVINYLKKGISAE